MNVLFRVAFVDYALVIFSAWKMGSFTKTVFCPQSGYSSFGLKTPAEVSWHILSIVCQIFCKNSWLYVYIQSPKQNRKRRYTCWYATLVGENIVVVFWKLKSRWGKLWKTFARVNTIFLHRILLHSLDPWIVTNSYSLKSEIFNFL